MKTRRAYDAAEAMIHRPKDMGLDDLPLGYDWSGILHVNEGDPQPPAAKARRILNAFEERKPTNASLAYVRGKLRELYWSRVRKWPEFDYVTADDAAVILEEWSEFPRGGSQNWRGSIFRGKAWERIYPDIPSTRDGWNGTPLARWRPRR